MRSERLYVQRQLTELQAVMDEMDPELLWLHVLLGDDAIHSWHREKALRKLRDTGHLTMLDAADG